MDYFSMDVEMESANLDTFLQRRIYRNDFRY